jgi:HEAT repeat protein
MSRAVIQPFEDYQKARISFVQTVAELATRPQNIEALYSAGVMALLRPLLLDMVPSIQQSAALAIGRLANHSEELAESVVKNDIISQLIYSTSNQNRFFKKAVCYVLKAVSKHSAELADDVVRSGALDPLVQSLEEFDPSVKECAAWAIGYIAKHNASLAYKVVEARAVDPLILCLGEPELSLKRAAAQTLSYICQHTEQLAQPVAENGLETITQYLNYKDTQLKRNVCLLLGNIAKHSVELANQVMLKISNPQRLLSCLKDEDLTVRKNAAFCVLELAKKTQENCASIITAGGAYALTDFIANTKGEDRLNGILSIGNIAMYKEDLAISLIKARAGVYLKDIIENEPNPALKSASCFALGHMGRHSSQHSKEITDLNILPTMLFYYSSPDSEDDLKDKSKKALKSIILQCNHMKALEPLIHTANDKILKHVLDQYIKYMNVSLEEKSKFIQNGCLQKLQGIKRKSSYVIKEKIEVINTFFPSDIIKYYSPDYAQYLISKIE